MKRDEFSEVERKWRKRALFRRHTGRRRRWLVWAVLIAAIGAVYLYIAESNLLASLLP